MLIKTPLFHQSSGPRVFLSLSLYLFFRLIPWSSADALWIHFPAWASKTLSRRHFACSLHWEGTWGLCEQSKPCVGGFIGFLRKPRNISLFSLLYFLNCKILSLPLSPFIYPFRQCHPREGIPGSNWGWTPVSSALSFLHCPILTSIYDQRKNHSLD